MVRKGRRTGVFDLHDVDAIQLNPPAIQSQQEEKNTNPKVFVEVTELKADNGKISIEKALMIVKEQMKISGIRPATSQEYMYIMKRFANEIGSALFR